MQAAKFMVAGELLRSTTLRVPSWLVTHKQPLLEHGEA